jgi:rhodanese-related sulfurtransferase
VLSGISSAPGPKASGSNARFAGDVLPKEVWNILAKDATAVLVDVRTPSEWAQGVPDLESLDKKAVCLSWRLETTKAVNEQFLTELEQAGIAKSVPVYFMCRTGGRSTDAAIAATAAGWQHCYNIEDGFEGAAQPDGTRGTINGWKASGLPWGKAV